MRAIVLKFFAERVIFMSVQMRKKFSTVIRAVAVGMGVVSVSCLLAVSLLHLPGRRAVEASAFRGSTVPAAANAEIESRHKVIPLGTSFGIKLYTDGVIVVSLSELYTADGLCCPAEQAGIHPGDYILTANGTVLSGNAQLAQMIGQSEGKSLNLTVRRGETEFQTELTPVESGGAFKAGMWVRDSAAGIGTLTFYDPDTGCFAGLGHGICDTDLGSVMSLSHGDPAPITLCGIVKGQAGAPGQLQGYFPSDETLGTLLANNETGVYGTFNDPPTGEAIEILPADEVTTGAVQIYAAIDETGAQLYDAEISRISRKGETKNLIVKITDERLLEQTGGIVQGMSGSPILQNGKLAGAITHVFTDDPTMGYGIFAETMCEQLKLVSDRAATENAA